MYCSGEIQNKNMFGGDHTLILCLLLHNYFTLDEDATEQLNTGIDSMLGNSYA